MDEAIRIVDTLAPEHLEVQVADADAVWKRVANYGAMFIGANSAEVRLQCGGGENGGLGCGEHTERRRRAHQDS